MLVFTSKRVFKFQPPTTTSQNGLLWLKQARIMHEFEMRGVGFELNDRWRCLHCTPANPLFFLVSKSGAAN